MNQPENIKNIAIHHDQIILLSYQIGSTAELWFMVDQSLNDQDNVK